MYQELPLIEQIPCKKAKVSILLMFIEEYGGWLQHLNNVGLKWGASGEEVGANKESAKTREHLNKLHDKVIELSA